MTNPSLPPLTEEEQKRWYSKFYYAQYPLMKDALAEIGDNGPMGPENAVSVAERAKIIEQGYHTRERGWQVMPDGTTHVRGMVFMKNVTPEMFQWWFTWMPGDPLRMRMWDPGSHITMKIEEETRDRICNPKLSLKERLYGNMLYAIEDNGTGFESNRSSYKKLYFVNPLEFGFSERQLSSLEAEGATIITAMSGPIDGEFASSFIHYARPAKGGCEVRSWFFVGYKIENGKPVKTMSEEMSHAALEQIGTGLTMHCLREYSHLSHILPEVYARHGQKVDTSEEFESYRHHMYDFM